MHLKIQETDTKRRTLERELHLELPSKITPGNGDLATKLNTPKLLNKMFRI